MNHENTSPDRLLRVAQVLEILPFSRSELYRRIDAKEIPAPIMLGPKMPVWRASSIAEYVEQLAGAAAK